MTLTQIAQDNVWPIRVVYVFVSNLSIKLWLSALKIWLHVLSKIVDQKWSIKYFRSNLKYKRLDLRNLGRGTLPSPLEFKTSINRIKGKVGIVHIWSDWFLELIVELVHASQLIKENDEITENTENTEKGACAREAW